LSSIVADAFLRAQATLGALGLTDPAVPPPLVLVLPSDPARDPFIPGPAGAGVRASGRGPGRAGPGTLAWAAAALRDGSITARALLEEALARLAASGDLGAIATLDEAPARAAADRLDAEAAAGTWRGMLHGIPLTVKDVIDVGGLPTRAGSAAFERLPPHDAASVARLRSAGAVILGKAATHEFALGVTTPQCRNPYDRERISGGSSGGSAVAVATGVGLGSLGTDTRASLRVPASLCGVVGFKPTYGRVPTAGVVPLGWTFDHVGPIATTVRDAFALLELLAASGRAEGVLTADPPDLGGMVVGVVTAAMERAAPAVAAAVEGRLEALERLGCKLVDAAFPGPDDLRIANDLGLLISRSEAATFHRSAGTDLTSCLPEVREQLLAGLEVTAGDYLDAQRQRAVMAARAVEAFGGWDVLASPTTPVTAPRRDDYERFLMALPESTILWSLVGSPALSMPAGTDGDGMPIGLQLCAPPGGDALIGGAGMALESAFPL
jgi:aspartyl-tRNA(Asn)/glutamyl-tRNA(Gln) amidotransferase subunit A